MRQDLINFERRIKSLLRVFRSCNDYSAIIITFFNKRLFNGGKFEQIQVLEYFKYVQRQCKRARFLSGIFKFKDE